MGLLGRCAREGGQSASTHLSLPLSLRLTHRPDLCRSRRFRCTRPARSITSDEERLSSTVSHHIALIYHIRLRPCL